MRLRRVLVSTLGLWSATILSQSTLEETPYKTLASITKVSRSVYRAPLLVPLAREKLNAQLGSETGTRDVGKVVDLPTTPKNPKLETVIASWYGSHFHGRRMANGERFNMNDLTAVAHRTLPLGTRLWLTNTANGKSTVVTVKDRGPWIFGREFDVSRGVANKLGFIREGLAPVSYSILSIPSKSERASS